MASPAMMARLRGFVETGVQTHVRGQTVWIGHPGIKVRAGNGELTAAGMEYENLVTRAGGRADTRLFHHATVPTLSLIHI